MTVLLFPVVQPWYVLWAVIPLAAWATRPAFRTTAIVVTLVVGIFGPTANGDRFTFFQILLATVASTVIVAAARSADHLQPAAVAQAARPAVRSTTSRRRPSPSRTNRHYRRRSAVKPDAYAESP